MALSVRKITRQRVREDRPRGLRGGAAPAPAASRPSTRRTCCASPTGSSSTPCAASREDYPYRRAGGGDRRRDGRAPRAGREPLRRRWSRPTCMATSCPTRRASSRAGSVSPRPSTPATPMPSPRPCTDRRPTSPGRGIANPVALVLSAGASSPMARRPALRARIGGGRPCAIDAAVTAALGDAANHTPDLGGAGTTDGMAAAIVRGLAKLRPIPRGHAMGQSLHRRADHVPRCGRQVRAVRSSPPTASPAPMPTTSIRPRRCASSSTWG